jgi:hypothetical protein
MASVLVKDSSVTRDSSDKGLGRIADEGWRRERAVLPSDGGFQSAARIFLRCARRRANWITFVALALQ